jgi:hypothetical protein
MNAKSDIDLLNRFIAKAELMGVDNAASLVQGNYPALLNTVVSDGQTIVDVHAYATSVRKDAFALTQVPSGLDLGGALALISALISPPPGQNPGAVTDAYLETAINAIRPPAPPA